MVKKKRITEKDITSEMKKLQWDFNKCNIQNDVLRRIDLNMGKNQIVIQERNSPMGEVISLVTDTKRQRLSKIKMFRQGFGHRRECISKFGNTDEDNWRAGNIRLKKPQSTHFKLD